MNTTTAFRTIARLTTTAAAVTALTLGLAGTSHADADGALLADPTHDLPANALHVEGSVDGNLDNPEVTCAKLADAAWSWTATGTVDGVPVEITFNTNHFRGAGDYATTGVTDEAGGLATLNADDGAVIVTSNADTVGTFTVGDDERNGSIDTTLDNAPYDQQVHVSGVWSCA